MILIDDLEALLLMNLVAAVLILWDDDEVVGSIGIDFDVTEFASRNSVLEENVQLGVGETLWFCEVVSM